MDSDTYGAANCIPSIGLILGSLVSAKLTQEHSFEAIIRAGIWITGIGVVFMLIAMWMNFRPIFSLFTSMIIIYFGLSFILANASVIAMSGVVDKAHGAAVMSFINMGLATLVVFILRAGTILSFSIPSSPCLCTFFIRKMLNVAQLHLRFFSIRTCKFRVTLGAKT